MSELFESLQFPLPPSSSPPCPLQEIGGSSRGNQSNVRKTPAERGQKGLVSKSGLHHLHQPHTPLSKVQKASSSSSSIHNRDEQSSNTTPLFTSTLSSRLNKPGHVFWHATPSPSQQIRQNEWQRHMSSGTSPTLPLGTQAFREELLHQGASNASSKTRQALIAGRVGDVTIFSSNRSATSIPSGSSIGKKFSRRASRRSAFIVGDAGIPDKSQGGEGMQQLLADLNQHLQSHENEVDDAEEESLVEELDRVFSSQRDISDSPPDGQEDQDKNKKMLGLEMICTQQSHPKNNSQLSPQSSREWSRTKSLPTMAPSPIQEGRSSLAKVHSANIPAKDGKVVRQILIKRTHSPSPCPHNTDTDGSASEERVSSASPTKGTSEEVWSEERKTIESGKCSTKGKTRSSVSPPKKWETRRTPRIGLSRHSIGASQVSSSLQNGPAAPFKRPTKAFHAIVPQKELKKDKDVIVIDDSDEDLIEEQQTVQPSRRTSPRKKTMLKQHHQQQHKKQSSNIVQQTKAPAQIEKKEMDEDTSFDTSMDDSILCDALEQAEARASQEAFQRKPPPPARKSSTRLSSIGDESFEMASSDNEAIVSAMEASGW